MNANKYRVNPRFAPEIGFAVPTTAAAPFRAALENDFERLKGRLLADELKRLAQPALNTAIRRAANEAAALAWVSFYPLLVFPALFEEKVAAAHQHAERQTRIYATTREILAA
jgi:hypothetical protein